MFEILQYQFFQNALLVAILTSFCAGIIGTYIVVKRISLISGSIAHAAFGGLGLSYYLGTNPLIGAIIFSLGSAFGIASVKNQKTTIDTLLSFLWATGMAVGLVFMFLTPGYATDLFTYLFGNILLVSRADLITILVLDIIILGAVILLYNPILAVLFDEEFATTRNLKVRAINLILFGLIALSIVATLRVVGIVLMIAILTIPAATARMWKQNIKAIMILASIITLFSTVAGLFISYWLDFATGPIIVLIISMIYLLSIGLSKYIKHEM